MFLAALAPRAAWILYRWSQDGPSLEYPDEELHWQLARNLIADGAMVSDDGRYAARMPVYPLFLSLFAWGGAAGIMAARLVQALLGAATVWIAHVFMKKRFGGRAAVAAAVLLGLDPFTIFFANLLLTEVVYIFISVSLILIAWRLATIPAEQSAVSVLGVGVLGAAALMTRPSAAGWIVALWGVLWLCDKQKYRAARRVVVWAAVMVVGLTPWGLRNIKLLGSPAWLSANGGVTLYDAQGPTADGSSNQTFMRDLPELNGLNEIDRDRLLRRLAVRQMRDDPVRVLRLAGVKFIRTWNFIPNVEEHSGGAKAVVSALFSVLVITAAVGGLILACRRRRRGGRGLGRLQLLLWTPVLYFTFVHCIFVGSLRYRVPLMPLLSIAGAAALVRDEDLEESPESKPC